MLVFFIFVRQFISKVQIFKLRKTDVHFSFLYKQIPQQHKHFSVMGDYNYPRQSYAGPREVTWESI